MSKPPIVVDLHLERVDDRELHMTATVRSGLQRDLVEWRLHFDLPKALTEGPDTRLCSQVGSHVILAPATNEPLAAGAEARLHCLGAIGMIQRLSDLPNGIYLSCAGEPDREIVPAVLGDHNLLAISEAADLPSEGSSGGGAPVAAPSEPIDDPPDTAAANQQTSFGIVPRPRHLQAAEGQLVCQGPMAHVGPPSARAAIVWLGGQLPLGSADPDAATLRFDTDPSLGAEAYRLQVTPETVVAHAATEAGFFYAAVTLVQLAEPIGDALRLPCVTIEDEPRFAYRGLMLDCARHFHSKETVLAVLDWMALFKLNGFHWHLTDDEGWRVEIEAFPALTERGAWRGEGELLEPQFGSGPGRYGGFYSRDEVREIVAYARARQIRVIPEIDIPGHSRAAIKACPELLVEEADTSRYSGAQIYTDNVLNPALPGTYHFLHTVLDEICELFPGEWIHLGADEVPEGVWENSPACRALMEEHGYRSPLELQGHLLRDLQAHLAARGRQLMGWEEIVHGDKIDHGAVANAWTEIAAAARLANEGYRVVACPAPYAYVDLAWSADVREPGYYWAGTCDLEACYGYEPYADDLSEDGKSRLLGVQAVLWSELVATPARLQYMLFPRLLALAETAWTPAADKDWSDFSGRLPRQMAMLDRRGIGHRPLDSAPA